MPLGSGEPRFLSLSDVSEVLNISAAQAYALVRRGDLAAIKIGGRGQWRIEASELEAYIQRQYSQTRDFIEQHPWRDGDDVFEAETADGPTTADR
jgi:excisionase family DNA binding protein